MIQSFQLQGALPPNLSLTDRLTETGGLGDRSVPYERSARYADRERRANNTGTGETRHNPCHVGK